VNWGAEARYLKRYNINDNRVPFNWSQILIKNTGLQGPGSSGSDANFNLANEFPFMQSIGLYIPNLNFAVFERIFSKFPQTFYHPGFRFEKYAPKQKDTAK
jgi:Fe(3+) dicitrate transport protein